MIIVYNFFTQRKHQSLNSSVPKYYLMIPSDDVEVVPTLLQNHMFEIVSFKVAHQASANQQTVDNEQNVRQN